MAIVLNRGEFFGRVVTAAGTEQIRVAVRALDPLAHPLS